MNWLDKSIWALARLGEKEVTRYKVYPIKVAVSCSLFLNLLFGLGILKALYAPGVAFENWPSSGSWEVRLLLIGGLVLSYIPVHVFTHSADKIARTSLSQDKRWVYTALGFLVVPGSWGTDGLDVHVGLVTSTGETEEHQALEPTEQFVEGVVFEN
jgi:hypothetical protein